MESTCLKQKELRSLELRIPQGLKKMQQTKQTNRLRTLNSELCDIKLAYQKIRLLGSKKVSPFRDDFRPVFYKYHRETCTFKAATKKP